MKRPIEDEPGIEAEAAAVSSGRKPRPEAVALGWKDMLRNTREATEALIGWLNNAIAESGRNPRFDKGRLRLLTQQFATSVLVAGDRGFGKTTVLLSAANAFENPGAFLPEEDRHAPRTRGLYEILTNKQKAILWLDPLDLEPLPPDANLLATLLVRIQNVLRPDDARTDKDGGTALLTEEGVDEPWAEISRLVREASFMWEKLPRQGIDARDYVTNQIKAAEIFATFRRRFYEAIDAVAGFQSLRRFGLGSDPSKVILVLPIDNVDRSIQHLNLILKLIRMVASPRLWFILASGGQEFQLFLERTFQQELSESGQLASGEEALDTALAIARRQAAGAIRRVLPAVHRIDIKPLTPEEIWNFKAPKAMAGGQEERRSIGELLATLRIPNDAADGKAQTYGPQWFADLFDVRTRLSAPGREESLLLREYRQFLSEIDEQETPEPKGARGTAGAVPDPDRVILELRSRGFVGADALFIEDYLRLQRNRQTDSDTARPIFTQAGKAALSMSARSAVDLWQLAQDASQVESNAQPHDPGVRRGRQAIRVAEHMLKLAIDESNLPRWASEELLNRVLRSNVNGEVFLDLTGDPIERLKLTTLSDALHWRADEDEQPTMQHDLRTLRSELHLRHVMDIILVLNDLNQPGRNCHLPPAVAGWYMLLHDLLFFTTDGRVLKQRVAPADVTPPLVVTHHEALIPRNHLVEFDLRWMLPEWGTFIDSFLFTIQWRAFLHRIQGLFRSAPEHSSPQHLRLILAAWIDAICAVSGETAGLWDWHPFDAVLQEVDGTPDPERIRHARIDEVALEKYEERVAGAVHAVFAWTQDKRIRYGRPSVARRWLKYFLPIMLMGAYLPRKATDYIARHVWKLGDYVSIFGYDQELLNQRIRSSFYKAVRESPAFAQREDLYNTDTGIGAYTCADWLERSADDWMQRFTIHAPSAVDAEQDVQQ